jgi:hypothetical protein
MRTFVSVAWALSLAACVSGTCAAGPDSDAPEARTVHAAAAVGPATYSEALARWRTAEDVNDWIGAHFEYDAPRALQLSETQRTGRANLPIHMPAALYGDPRGICVDLARFAVETLRDIEPQSNPAYLMIEFDPVLVDGQVLRRHWVASFKRAGRLYFFADSKRPSHIAGPYATTSEYIAEYAAYRQRQIVGFKDLSSFQRQTRVRASKLPRDAA